MVASGVSLEEAGWDSQLHVPLRRDTWRRFRRNRLAVTGLVIALALAALALLAPVLMSIGVIADPYQLDLADAHAPISAAHPLGTDQLGRDLLSRTVHGGRVSLSIGILVQVPAIAIGGTIGLVAGYAGGWIDNALMRLTDAMFVFPDLLFVLVVASVLGPGYWNIVIALSAVNWVFMARLVRGEVLAIKEQDYIAAARAAGTGPVRMALRHLVPNSLGPIIVTVAFGIPAAVFTEAFLSFIGVGMSPPTPSWGAMVNEGFEAVFAYTHQLLAPALAISLASMSFNFMGDGLRDALDPRLRR